MRRHWGILITFVVFVMIPTGLSGWYLWARAADQFASTVGFTVRREDAPSAVDLLGGLGGLTANASSSDSDILAEFIRSQDLVMRIDGRIDLRSHYAQFIETDPFFALAPDASLEDLITYWNRMVQVSYAPGTGLIEVRVLAFNSEMARTIATVLFQQSNEMINTLSAIAQEDAIAYARDDLNDAIEVLKSAREGITAFRIRTQIIDPLADIQIQMGLLSAMQQRLGDELIALDLLHENARGNDSRITEAELRVNAIRQRIEEERAKFGASGDRSDGTDYASLVAEYERLSVDLEFAERKYATALVGSDRARTEAERQSRYLAAYIQPTLAETAEHPRRWLLLGLILMFSLFSWAILVLLYYSLRDRR